MKEFFYIANENPGIRFSLYGIGYDIKKLEKQNESLRNKVIIKDCLEPWQMASEYKKNNWLLYTACHNLKNVGWPMAIAEAQASGLCIFNEKYSPRP